MSAPSPAPTSARSWRGLTLDERYFLRIAQKNGLVDDATIAEVLHARATLRRKGRARSVQEIMLDAGMLSPEQVDAIHEAQAASQTIRLDSLYADIALRLGYARREQLEAMFALQRERDYRVRVGELLLARGAITPEQHRRVLTELLASLRADEKEYIRTIGLKKRLATPPDPAEAERERMRLLRTEPGTRPERAAAPPPPPPAREAATPAVPPAPTGSLQDWLGSSSVQDRPAPPSSEDDEPFVSSDDELAIDLSDAELGLPSPPASTTVPESFLSSNISAIRAEAAPDRSAGERHAPARERAKGGATRRQLLESAIDVLEESERLGMDGAELQREDIRAVERALESTDDRRRGRRRSRGRSREDAFSAERYLQLRRRRLWRVRLAVAAALLAVLVPTGWGILTARRNLRTLAAAEAALEAGELERAQRLADETGAFWVGEQRRERLREEIALARALAPVRALQRQGRWEQALTALREAERRLPQHAERFEALEREIRVASLLAAGRERQRRGEFAAAVQRFREAAELDPEASTPREAIEAVRTHLQQEILAAEAAARGANDEAAAERQIAAYRSYLEAFPEQGARIERKLLEHELRRALGQAERAVAEGRYDDALGAYYRAGAAAERLEKPGLRAEIEEKTRMAHRLSRYRKSFEQGQQLERAGRYEAAVGLYRQAAAWLPDDDPRAQEVRERIAACERARRRHDVAARAKALWDEAIEALRASRIEQAQAALRALTELDPSDERARRTLAWADRLDDMVYVPAGPAVIGTDRSDAPAARPQHTVRLPAFFIDRYEVRNRAFARWVRETGAAPPRHWKRGEDGTVGFAHEQADHPVVEVDFEQARRYAAWAGKRLPTEFEWEKAARGGDARIWPWGNDPHRRRVNVAADSSERLPIHTRPVGTSADDRSPYGCMDMAGNVSEWCDSPFVPYPGGDPDAAPFDPKRKVLRGGSWRYGLHYARAFNRDRATPDSHSPYVGFRCVVDIPDWLEALR